MEVASQISRFLDNCHRALRAARHGHEAACDAIKTYIENNFSLGEENFFGDDNKELYKAIVSQQVGYDGNRFNDEWDFWHTIPVGFSEVIVLQIMQKIFDAYQTSEDVQEIIHANDMNVEPVGVVGAIVEEAE